MAYVLLVIGAVMAAVGVYAVVTGYGVIQVEEGWTSVISGTVLFTGGMVMAALGLVLRTLSDLSSALVTRPSTEPSIEGLVGSPENISLIDPRPTAAVTDISPVRDTPIDPPLFAEPPAAHVETYTSASTGQLNGAHEPAASDDDYKLETPSTNEHDLLTADRTARPPPPAKAPPVDDWLDRAFAEIDQETPEVAPPKRVATKTKSTIIPPEKRSGGARIADGVAPPEVAPPVAAEAPEPEPPVVESEDPPPAAASTPATTVIGRYEADGTSYVMYADGSIEAQTYSGIYRFASMAELKAFIES
jgi:hypothetical protein